MALFVSLSNQACAINDVGGTLITLTNSATAPNGAWSWFEDERAIIDDSDPNNTLLLISSVSAASNSSAESGDIDLLWLNIDTGQQGEFEFNNRLQRDDHNSASLWRRPSDGRYVAAYGKHGTDNFMRWRVSTNPGDPTAWEPEQLLDASPFSSEGATYNNLHYLPNDNNGMGRLYNFTRSVNWDPNVITSNDGGESWTYAGKLLTQGGSSNRPYVRYYSEGDRVHLITTEQHPRNFNNSIFHGYVENGVLYNSNGAIVDNNLFNSAAASPSDLTTVFAANTVIGDASMQRAWTIDVAIDGNNSPVAVFTARANGNDNDHRFFYGTLSNGEWSVNEIAKAGGFLYAAENDYTGLLSIDPNDTSTVYMSTDVDPRNDVPLAHYEIFRGNTTNDGVTWSWDPITFDSTVDNLRPLVPDWNENETALVWMRGNYNSFTSWDTEVVAITDFSPLTTSSIADLNNDGDVTLADYELFLNGFHGSFVGVTDPQNARQLGDFNNDFQSDYSDFIIFQREYSLFNGMNSLSVDALTLIPEPGSAALLITSLFLVTNRQRSVARPNSLFDSQ